MTLLQDKNNKEQSLDLPSWWGPLLTWWVESSSPHTQSTTTATPTKHPSNPTEDRGLPSRHEWARLLLVGLTTCNTTASDFAPFHLAPLILSSVVAQADPLSYPETTTSSSTQSLSTMDLRTLAWMTAARLVSVDRSASTSASTIRRNQWEWLLITPPPPAADTTSLSTTTRQKYDSRNLCALVRLAAGEWRIQLSLALTRNQESTSHNNHNTDNDSNGVILAQACATVVAQACATVVAQALDLLVGQVEPPDDDYDDAAPKWSLTPQDLLHMRHSLQDALDATVQYLLDQQHVLDKQNEEQQQTNNNSRGEWDPVVIRLLGALLTEWDVFLETTTSAATSPATQQQQQSLPQTGDTGVITTNPLLFALRMAMLRATATTTQNSNRPTNRTAAPQNLLNYPQQQQQQHQNTAASLLPAIATVLASAEGDDSRMALLRDYHVLDQGLDDFLASYFDHVAVATTVNNTDSGSNSNQQQQAEEELESSMPWASQVIDLWTTTTTMSATSVQAPHTLRSITACLQRLLNLQKHRKNVLSSAVTSFVTLQGDEPPGDKETRILQQAFATLEKKD